MAEASNQLTERLVPEIRGMWLDGTPSTTSSLQRFGRRAPSGSFGPFDDPEVLKDAGFVHGARAFHEAYTPVSEAGFPLSSGYGFAISSVAVVSSAQAARRAAHDLFPSLRDPRPLSPGSTRSNIEIEGIPNAFGVRGRNSSGASAQIAFSHDEAVYWLTTFENGLPAPPLDAEELVALMRDLYERMRGTGLPAAPDPEPTAPAPPARAPDPDAHLLWSKTITASADYHQVAIADMEIDWPDDVDDDAADDAKQSGRHVGWADGYVVMSTPSQWHFEMPVTIEGWSAEPAEPADLGDWQEIVDVDLRVDSGILTFMAPAGEPHDVEVPTGRYRARICGGGFTEQHMDGDEEGSDHYLIRLWPASDPAGPLQLRTWDGWESP